MPTKITNYYKFPDLPFAKLGSEILERPELKEILVADFIAHCGLKAKNSWFLPQLVSHISNWTLPSTAKISAKDFLTLNVKGNDFNTGIYYLCTHRLRGNLVAAQNTEEGLPYSALVPLLMMPFKKLHNVDYNKWERSELKRILDPNMVQFLEFEPPVLDRDEMLLIREEGLRYKTGSNVGKCKKSQSTIRLNSGEHDFPWYYQVATFQIWVGHPSLRHKYMILDNQNLDNMPEPLISTEVLAAPKTVPTYVNPWD